MQIMFNELSGQTQFNFGFATNIVEMEYHPIKQDNISEKYQYFPTLLNMTFWYNIVF